MKTVTKRIGMNQMERLDYQVVPEASSIEQRITNKLIDSFERDLNPSIDVPLMTGMLPEQVLGYLIMALMNPDIKHI